MRLQISKNRKLATTALVLILGGCGAVDDQSVFESGELSEPREQYVGDGKADGEHPAGMGTVPEVPTYDWRNPSCDGLPGPSSVKGNGLAVLLIDFQMMDLSPPVPGTSKTMEDSGIANGPEELENMAAVLAKANQEGTLVYEINYHGTADPRLAQLRGPNWRHLSKPWPSAFEDSCLDNDLRQHSISDVVVMGFAEVACVAETAKSARSLGYEVYASFDVMQNSITAAEYQQWIDEGSPLDEEYGLQAAARGLFDEPFSEVVSFYEDTTRLVNGYTMLPVFYR